MIKFERLPDDIFERLPKAQSSLESCPDVVFAYLFGGLARGAAGPLSDVDIAVYLSAGVDPTDAKATIIGGLIDALSTDEIDLVVLNTAPLPLKARVLRTKKLLVDKKPFSRHAFESLALREYFDFSIKETAFFKRRYNLG